MPPGSARSRSSTARAASARRARVFFNTLLDENAASHIALGNAYATPVGDEDRDRINESAIHIDFMIGSDDVSVTGRLEGRPRRAGPARRHLAALSSAPRRSPHEP